jgi:hypothetical protein
MKFNADGAVASNGRRGVAEAICRDANGVYQGASAIVFSGITGPITLEALACREARSLVEDLGVHKLCVASDCQGSGVGH